jgi:hypothetical protein
VNRAFVAAAALVLSSIGAACSRTSESQAAPPGPAPTRITLDHLQHLGLNAVVRGRKVRVVSLYAEAPDYRPTGSPKRDGFEGIASLDDAARAAVVYLREYEATGDSSVRDEAVRLLNFVTAMEQGDGEFVNFIDSAGRLNRDAPSSRQSMSYWAARSIWALGEAVRVLGPKDSTLLTTMRPVLRRAIDRMSSEIEAERLIGGSTTATSEALLGLLAAQTSRDSTVVVPLATRTAQLLAQHSEGGSAKAPWGAYVDRANAPWHAWGARSPEALAIAGRTLKHPEFIASARKEADGLWGRFLLAGGMPSQVGADGNATWYPQIAYGVGPIVEGYLALAEATGQRRYAVFAGLAASWLLGSNPAGVGMYDEKSGRTFDGIDGPSPIKLNRNSGAESTIEGLLALQSVESNPDAAQYTHYRPVGDLSTSLANVPDRREYIGPGGARLILRRGPAGIEIARDDQAIGGDEVALGDSKPGARAAAAPETAPI